MEGAADCDRADLLAILGVAHESSMRGAGLSLVDAVSRTRYAELRGRIDVDMLARVVRRHPSLIDQWQLFSYDQRSSDAHYLDGNTIGTIDPRSKRTYPHRWDAVAAFAMIVLERALDRAP